MKTTLFFSVLLSFLFVCTLAAQTKTYSSGVTSTTLKPGDGARPADGKEVFFQVVVSTPDGKEMFSTRLMNVPFHQTVGQDADAESMALYEVMKDMQTNGKYRLEVPKTIMNDKGLAASLTDDHIVYEMELIQVTDAHPSGAKLVQKTMMEKGVAAGQAQFDALQSRNPDGYTFIEWDMNVAGYETLGKGKMDEAIALFKMNTQLNAGSWNAYDSLGDAYLAKGDKANAKASFEKALQLNPDFAVSREKLDKL